jgi:hypothetical protein
MHCSCGERKRIARANGSQIVLACTNMSFRLCRGGSLSALMLAANPCCASRFDLSVRNAGDGKPRRHIRLSEFGSLGNTLDRSMLS